jgi:hypothetical protein
MKVSVVVEGHGDVEAVPVLVRRIAARLGVHHLEVGRPHRVPRSKMVKHGELERVIELVARKAGPEVPILVVADADDDCPAELGPQLQARAKQQRGDRRIAVVVAKREFEAWFVAACPSLAASGDLVGDVAPPARPEEVSGAKEWLDRHMSRGYSETLDQPRFAAIMDLDQAATAPSFRKLLRDVERLLRLDPGGG